MLKPLTGPKIFVMFALAFAVIITVNLFMAFKAVKTFPGLETRNSYVASQNFDADRSAQIALGWDVGARVEGDDLVLMIRDGEGRAVAPEITSAIFGRATTTRDDLFPEFLFDGISHRAPVGDISGNWNLRLEAIAADGTLFRQRIIVRVHR